METRRDVDKLNTNSLGILSFSISKQNLPIDFKGCNPKSSITSTTHKPGRKVLDRGCLLICLYTCSSSFAPNASTSWPSSCNCIARPLQILAMENKYHLRTVADTASKACFICYKPTTKVLITPDNKVGLFLYDHTSLFFLMYCFISDPST